jgi:predicted dehydrogenase
MSPLAVAIVGCGVISHVHATAILRHPRLQIAALVDPDPAAAAALAATIADLGRPAPPTFPDLAAALTTSTVDVVVICTPSGAHADIAEEALSAGRHVVVEKPLDAGLPAARRLAAAATSAAGRGQVVAVISQHRFDPATVAVRDAVRAGRFGQLTSAVASVAWWRSQEYYDSAGWRGTWAQDGGGATMNQGVHTVDLLVWLLGQPVEVYAHTGQLAHDRIAVEDIAVATVRFAGGAVAVVHATTAAYPGLSVRLQIHGSLGSAIIHDDQLEYFHAGDPAGAVGSRGEGGAAANQAAAVVAPGELRGAEKAPDAFVVGHLRQYQDVVEAIDGGRPPGGPVDEALLAVAVVKAMYVSATLGQPVVVADVLAGKYDDTPDIIGG